jgi:hypothetical protein
MVSIGSRNATALRSALAAGAEVIRASIEEPTIRPEQASLTAQR